MPILKYMHAHVILNVGMWCNLKRVIQFLFEGVDRLFCVVKVGDEHIVGVYDYDDDLLVLLDVQTSELVKVSGCKLF